MKALTRANINATTIRQVKILQFGEGHFLRAFIGWIVDILNEKTSFQGAIEIVQPNSHGMAALLNQQEGLFHVFSNGIQDGKIISETRLITSVKDAYDPHRVFNRFIKSAENPHLQFVVSYTNDAGIEFHPTDRNHSVLSETYPGKVAQLLYHRYNYFQGDPTKGLIMLPCELVDNNGAALKQAVLKYVDLWKLSSMFKVWIEKHTIFCNTLIDRIVPEIHRDALKDIQTKVGFEDNLAVITEPFLLWIIEANETIQKKFPQEKIDLPIKFVDDLTPYRNRKVRILNGAHTILVPVGYLQGLRTVSEAINDATCGAFVREAIQEEIIPTLDLPKEELEQFARDVMERFQNPFIRHELSTIALNSISKYKIRVLPSVLEYHKRTNLLPQRLLKALAAMILFYRGTWKGKVLPVNDTSQIMNFFSTYWNNHSVEEVVHATLANRSFWETDLTKIPQLKETVMQYIHTYLEEEQ
jgi:tagaturonate reductase